MLPEPIPRCLVSGNSRHIVPGSFPNRGRGARRSISVWLLTAAVTACSVAPLFGGTVVRQSSRPRRRGARIAKRISIAWSGSPLREATERLGANQRRTIFVDRRVDPDMRVELTVDAQSWERVLAAIADRTGLRLDWIGPVAYLGPPHLARPLTAVAASRRAAADQLPADARKRWLGRNAMQWEALATPADLVRRLAEHGKADVQRIERVPHDLWPAASFPPLPLVDRLTLVTYGLNLSFEFDRRGKVVRLVPIRAIPLVRHRATSPPPATATPAAGKPVRGRRHRSAEQRYTLRIKDQPIGRVLEQLGKKLGLEIVIDREGLRRDGIRLETRVSLDVRQATLDQLLTAVLRPAGLTDRRDGRTVHIERLSDR